MFGSIYIIIGDPLGSHILKESKYFCILRSHVLNLKAEEFRPMISFFVVGESFMTVKHTGDNVREREYVAKAAGSHARNALKTT